MKHSFVGPMTFEGESAIRCVECGYIHRTRKLNEDTGIIEYYPSDTDCLDEDRIIYRLKK